MKQVMPWNVTGIPPEAREIARAAAARDGVSVGDWLTRCIYLDSQRGPQESITAPDSRIDPKSHGQVAAANRQEILHQLARMEGANESALRRIDETLRTLARQADANAGPQSQTGISEQKTKTKIDAGLREQARLIGHLARRMENFERSTDLAPLRKAARGLHQCVARLAEQAAKNEISTTNRIEALAGNIDAVSRSAQEARATSSHLTKDLEERLSALTEQIARSDEALGGMEERVQEMLEDHSAHYEQKLDSVSARLGGTERAQREQARTSIEALENIKERLNTTERANRETYSEFRRTLEEMADRLDSLQLQAEEAREKHKPATDNEFPSSLPGMSQELAPRNDDSTVTNAVQRFLSKARRSASSAPETQPAAGEPSLASVRPIRKTDEQKKEGTSLRRAFPVISVGFLLATGVGYLIVSSGVWAFGKSVALPRDATVSTAAYATEAEAGALPTHFEEISPLADGIGTGEMIRASVPPGQDSSAVDLLVESKAGFETSVTAAPALAAIRFEQAARSGHRSSMHNLAVAHVSGNGIERNLAEASRWFRYAADLGHTDSQFNLAVLFEHGMGVPISVSDAYKWYFIAAASGDGEAQTRAELLSKQLSEEQRQAVERAATNYVPQPPKPATNELPTLAQLQ